MSWIASLLGLVAACCFYLSAPQQRVRVVPLGRRGRYAGSVLAVAAFALWIVSLDTMAGVFSALTAIMSGAVLLPYAVWWIRPAAARGTR
jgi:hypothetical protein